MKDITVLMTGAGAPGAPGIITCYRNNGERNIRVIGVDMKSRVPSIRLLDDFFVVPSADNYKFLDSVLNIAVNNNVDIIQPLVTKELEVFATNEKIFNEVGIKICVSKIDNLKIANDKGLLLNELKKAGLAIPEFITVKKTDEFYEACKKIGYPERTICFKPTKSNGSRGFRIIDPEIDKGHLLFKEKPNSTYIKYEEVQEVLSSMNEIPELLVMEYLPGKEYSVDMLVENGDVKYCIPRLRTEIKEGISTRCVIEKNSKVIEYCCEVAKKLMLNGNVGIQVRYSLEDEVKILEINPRVQGSIVACTAAGVNLPYLGIKLALGEQIPKLEIKWNIEMLRYWKEVYFDNEGYAFTF